MLDLSRSEPPPQKRVGTPKPVLLPTMQPSNSRPERLRLVIPAEADVEELAASPKTCFPCSVRLLAEKTW